jgi:hypothetical protein
MKPIILASALLFSAGLFAQDNVIAATVTANNETLATYSLNEVKITNTPDELLLGELDAKSKKGRVIGQDNKIAYYFENTFADESGYLKTMLFKVQKVKYKTEARLRLYKKRDYVQEVYPPGSNTKESYDSFIPGDAIATDEIVVVLEPGQKGIIEIDLSKYGIVMPADGLFVSLEGVGYFDESGKAVTNLKAKEWTWVDFHPTVTDNYCEWINPQNTNSWFWINTNKWIKSDFAIVFKKEPSKKILTAPNFGLKVERR